MSNSSSTKDYKICDVLGGFVVTRFISLNARNLFASAIEDIELIREVVSETAYYGGIANGFSSLQALNQSLDWRARGLPEGTTTIDAELGYVDDRKDRRIDRQVGLSGTPYAGTKQNDMTFVDSLSTLLPWVVDRKSKEHKWWKNHENGRSEGVSKEPFSFDRLYVAAWITTWAEASTYYPPLSAVYGFAYTQGDVLGPQSDSHDTAYISPNIPQNNPQREASFTKPYPDNVVLGLSLVSAVAPVYLTGPFQGVMYNDTFMGSVGIDIAIGAISSLLDVLQDSITNGSFGLIVDHDFSTIVISQAVVSKIYPKLTGFEDDRVTYEVNGSIAQDRRNQSYLPSDTILQDLTNLTNANWTSLLEIVRSITPGERDYTSFDVLITGDSTPTEFYVWFERWDYVADWVVLVFAPVENVERAVNIAAKIRNSTGELSATAASFQTERGLVHHGEAAIYNQGSLDIIVQPKLFPHWVTLNVTSTDSFTLKPGEILSVGYQVVTESLGVGTQSSALVFDVRDANYPDCFFSEQLQLRVSVTVIPKTCSHSEVADAGGNCVCDSSSVAMFGSCVADATFVTVIVVPILILALIGVYWYASWRRKKADAVWRVDASEIKFGSPPEVIGQGSFGVVVLGEYRGTQVAVKKVLRPKGKKGLGSSRNSAIVSSRDSHDSIENGGVDDVMGSSSGDNVSDSNEGDGDVSQWDYKAMSGVMASSYYGIKSRRSGTRSSYLSRNSRSSQAQRRAAFIEEMRFISKLRHPCIVTVMGAVVNRKSEPMLVMEYMEHGSLYVLLHNLTMEFDGSIVLSILQDISHGIQFLHNTTPQVVHGDLKTANILVDIRFRAKVSDFGLSLSRNKTGIATGTTYWMAPELLQGISRNTTSSDVYSFGIMLYEIYARKNPYEGEKRSEVLRGVCDTSVNKRPPVPTTMPVGVALLMNDSLHSKAEERPIFDEISTRIKRFETTDVEPVGVVRVKKGGEKNFDVLLNMFPRHIAEALRDGRKIEPEHHNLVTIFFSDIVGFTTISSELAPQKVADMLHRLFFRFDALADAHEIFKVETIGDAWMGVTNCVKDQSADHVKRIALFALDAVKAASDTMIDEDDPSRGSVQIRVGFHSGPVLSNVIGSHNPHYSLFGDTVNTASRMESNSIPGKIHCSERAALLLQEQAPELKTKCRGEIKIKGKGKMTTYWVNSTDRRISEEYMDVMALHGSFSDQLSSSFSQLKRTSLKQPTIVQMQDSLTKSMVLTDSFSAKAPPLKTESFVPKDSEAESMRFL